MGYVPQTLTLHAYVKPTNVDYEDQKEEIFASNC